MNLIQILEQEEIARVSAGKTIPDFRAGDTVVVNVNVIEGSRRSSFARSPRAKASNVRSSSMPRRSKASW